jgi:hypothetical protein
MDRVFVASERRTVGLDRHRNAETWRVYRRIAALYIQAVTIPVAVSLAPAQAMTMAISAFWACRRFSASSQAAEPGPCSTSWVISWP